MMDRQELIQRLRKTRFLRFQNARYVRQLMINAADMLEADEKNISKEAMIGAITKTNFAHSAERK